MSNWMTPWGGRFSFFCRQRRNAELEMQDV